MRQFVPGQEWKRSMAVGDLALDLEGPWARDADIAAGCTGAACIVRAPDAAGLRLEDGTEWRAPGAGEIAPPTLRLSTADALGRMRIGRGDDAPVGSDDR